MTAAAIPCVSDASSSSFSGVGLGLTGGTVFLVVLFIEVGVGRGIFTVVLVLRLTVEAVVGSGLTDAEDVDS